MTEAETIQMEQAITNLVRDFYAKARKDAELGPIFNNAVHDWDVHLRVVANFWSKVLLQTDRYNGHPYVAHVKLPIELEHFGIWLKLFTETANDTLPQNMPKRPSPRPIIWPKASASGFFPSRIRMASPRAARSEAAAY